MSKSTRQTVEQCRAAQAWHDIKAIKDDKNKKEDEYKSLVRSIPAMVLSHGLGQTLAFLRSKGYEGGKLKGDKPHGALYCHLSNWVCEQMGWGKNSDLLLTKLTSDPQTATTANYRRATVETLAYIQWLKRFAEAELEGSGAS